MTALKKNDNIDDFTEDDLNKIFEDLSNLETQFINEAKSFFKVGGKNGHIHTMDFFTSAIINRAISLMRGFVTLAKENNYITAVPLIRIQLDNCLRFYATTLVDDYDVFFINYLKGKHIRNLKDSTGAKMTDTYLISKLDTIFPGVHKLYSNSSGFIHFSNEHSFIQTSLDKDIEGVVGTRIGLYDFFSMYKKVDFTYNMFKASEILLNMTKSWKFQKLKVEAEISK